MSNEKMRAEFDAAFCDQFGFGRMTAESNPDAEAMLKCAEWAWQASRAALCVELPNRKTFPDDLTDAEYFQNSEFNLARMLCKTAIESTGVKTK
jgi:hypothetical protein